MKKILLAFGMVLGLSLGHVAGISAEEGGAEEKKIGYTVGLDFGTTYLWRGIDVFQAAADTGSVFNFAPAIFPTVTLAVPESGLSFNVWSSFALMYRDPSESELEAADEIDLTAAYTIADKSGSFSAAFIGYLYPTTGSAGLLESYPELLLSYTAPVILSPTLGVASAFGFAGGSTEYGFLKISHAIELDKLVISPSLLFGAWLYNSDSTLTKLHLDIVVPVMYKITDSFEAHLALTGSYRIDGYDDNNAPFILVATIGASGSF